MSNAEQMMVPEQATVSAPGYVPPSMQNRQQQQRAGPLYDVAKVVRDFWPGQMRRIEHMTESEMREHCKHMELPMARVKKVMRIDDDVRSQSDIAAAASRFEHFDFLIDIVPREDSKKIHNELTNNSLNATSDGVLGTPAQVQYVLAGDGASGNDVYHLENGQVLHATPIGQPIPIGGASAANIDISQLPPGMQILHIPSQ